MFANLYGLTKAVGMLDKEAGWKRRLFTRQLNQLQSAGVPAHLRQSVAAQRFAASVPESLGGGRAAQSYLDTTRSIAGNPANAPTILDAIRAEAAKPESRNLFKRIQLPQTESAQRRLRALIRSRTGIQTTGNPLESLKGGILGVGGESLALKGEALRRKNAIVKLTQAPEYSSPKDIRELVRLMNTKYPQAMLARRGKAVHLGGGLIGSVEDIAQAGQPVLPKGVGNVVPLSAGNIGGVSRRYAFVRGLQRQGLEPWDILPDSGSRQLGLVNRGGQQQMVLLDTLSARPASVSPEEFYRRTDVGPKAFPSIIDLGHDLVANKATNKVTNPVPAGMWQPGVKQGLVGHNKAMNPFPANMWKPELLGREVTPHRVNELLAGGKPV